MSKKKTSFLKKSNSNFDFKMPVFKQPAFKIPSFKQPSFNFNNTFNTSKILNKYNLKSFGGVKDNDFDGVSNSKDCQPNNTFRQDFVPFKYNTNDEETNMSAAKRFGTLNILNLQKLGQGRDRVVYALDKDKVLKVAKNPGGLTQNQMESALDYPTGQIKHYETGKDYVVMERAQPPGKATNNMLRHLKKARDARLGNFLNKHESQIRADFFNSEHFEASGLDSNDFSSHSVDPQEFVSKRQWGEKDGQPVLIDGGALTSGQDLRRYRIKHFQQVANIDSSKEKPWQLTDWQDVQKERKQFKNKGILKEQQFNKGYPEADLANVNIFNNDDYSQKGASLKKQSEWQDMNTLEKIEARETKLDTDGDRVPDEYDCQPDNTLRQDTIYSVRSFKELNPKGKIHPSDRYDNMPGRHTGWFGTGVYGYDTKQTAIKDAKRNKGFVREFEIKKPLKLSNYESKQLHDYDSKQLYNAKSEHDRAIAAIHLKEYTNYDFTEKDIKNIQRQAKRMNVNPLNIALSKAGFDGIIPGDEYQNRTYGSVKFYDDIIPNEPRELTLEEKRLRKEHNINHQKQEEISRIETREQELKKYGEILDKPYPVIGERRHVGREDQIIDIDYNDEQKLDAAKKFYGEERYRKAFEWKDDISMFDNVPKGASLQKQSEWKDMSKKQRNIERFSKNDTDGDRVPDEYDCQPNNIMHQGIVYHGTTPMASMQIKTQGILTSKEIKDNGSPYFELSNKTNPSRTYFFDTKEKAAMWSKLATENSMFPQGIPKVIEVDVSDNELFPDVEMPIPGAFYKHGHVKPSQIKNIYDVTEEDLSVISQKLDNQNNQEREE